MLNNDTDLMKSFMTAAGLLPQRLWRGCYSLNENQRLMCEDIRVRLNRPLVANVGGENVILHDDGKPIFVQKDELDTLIANITDSSVHTYNRQITSGYITSKHGHRIGLCGEMAEDKGTLISMRSVSSAMIRIGKDLFGIADRVSNRLCQSLGSTLIIAPPGAGKTTFIRDLARRLSTVYSVSVIDERDEIMTTRLGSPAFNAGHCDILSGTGKKNGIEMLIRSMAPQIIVLDEITSDQDAETLIKAAHSGCHFIATLHGKNINDLQKRRLYTTLMDAKIFENIIEIKNQNKKREYTLWQWSEEHDKNDWPDNDNRLDIGGRTFYKQKS